MTCTPKTTPRRPMKGERYLSVDGESWGYRVGKQNTVIVRPNDTKIIVGNHALTGTDPSTFERGQRKGTSDGMVTPDHVRTYILAHTDVTSVKPAIDPLVETAIRAVKRGRWCSSAKPAV